MFEGSGQLHTQQDWGVLPGLLHTQDAWLCPEEPGTQGKEFPKNLRVQQRMAWGSFKTYDTQEEDGMRWDGIEFSRIESIV